MNRNTHFLIVGLGLIGGCYARRLTALGYYTFRITGKYQERSQKAVSDFQAASGLPVTGKADDALQALLFSEEAAPKPTPTPAPTLSLKEAYTNPPAQTCAAFRRV